MVESQPQPATLTPQDTIARLGEALERVQSLGIALAPNSRFKEYLRVLERAAAGEIGDEEKRERAQAFLEVSQLLAIDKHLLQDDVAAPLKWKVGVVLNKDAVLPSGSGQNTKARDFQFELYLASLFKCGGLDVRYETADLEVRLGQLFVGIEAKRPKSAARLAERMRKAREQLAKNQLITHGVIALDATYMANPRGHVLVTASESSGPAAQRLTALPSQHAEEIVRSWSTDAEDLRSTCALLVFAAVTQYQPETGGVINSRHIRCPMIRRFEHVTDQLKSAAERCFERERGRFD